MGLFEKKYLDYSGLVTFWNKIKDNFVRKETGKVLSSNDYTTSDKDKLSGIDAGAQVNEQSDWNESNTSSDAFIKNKPTIPSDSNLVHKTGDETISGNKTFNGNLTGKQGVSAEGIGDLTAMNAGSGEVLEYKDMKHWTATASGSTYQFAVDAEFKRQYLTLNISAQLTITFDPTASCAEQYILLRNSSNAEVTVGFNRSGSTGEMIGDTAVKVAAGGAVEVSLIATNGNVCVVTL